MFNLIYFFIYRSIGGPDAPFCFSFFFFHVHKTYVYVFKFLKLFISFFCSAWWFFQITYRQAVFSLDSNLFCSSVQVNILPSEAKISHIQCKNWWDNLLFIHIVKFRKPAYVLALTSMANIWHSSTNHLYDRLIVHSGLNHVKSHSYLAIILSGKYPC